MPPNNSPVTSERSTLSNNIEILELNVSGTKESEQVDTSMLYYDLPLPLVFRLHTEKNSFSCNPAM